MSIGLCGYMDFSSDSLSDEVFLSHFIVGQSVKYKLGCKLGGNVSRHAYNILESNPTGGTMFIEIMDTPLDNYADGMLQPNIDIRDASETDIADIIKSNLDNLQNFLQSIINYKNINRIVLYFNYEFWQNEDKTVDVNINNFSDIMLDYYKKNDYSAPVLKIVIDNN